MKIRKNEEGSTGEKLARFLLGYRTTPHTATGCTPAEILMGRRLRTRLDILHPSLANKMDKKSHQLPKLTKRKLEIGDPVMVKDYRARRDRWIQGVIQMKLSPVTYQVLVDDVLWKRHIDQLRSLAGSTVPDGKTKQDAEKYPSNLETQKSLVLDENTVSKHINQEIFKEPTVSTTTTLKTTPLPQVQTLPDKITKEPGSCNDSEQVSNNRRYPLRNRTKPKRLIDEI
ncbi:uncharacterized protein LOC124456513 [Xenia sp. Carnegie-2017]|uniref:uncharacterized protein LOC124456513 n=1 Tax=Xenia sp. Carnegie-2017 TaxID=2897299 RepID=UPI001F03B2F7|nr:uncharacterized protein LOC124456513 [Xenia sp. Carnegie-2017]